MYLCSKENEKKMAKEIHEKDNGVRLLKVVGCKSASYINNVIKAEWFRREMVRVGVEEARVLEDEESLWVGVRWRTDGEGEQREGGLRPNTEIPTLERIKEAVFMVNQQSDR